MQEGAGVAGYEVENVATNVTYSNITWVVVDWCSHYPSRYGHKHDGTRNVPAQLNNNSLDALGNSIKSFTNWAFTDRYAQVDLDPESSIELSSLANDWEQGDTPSTNLFVDQHQSNIECNFTLYSFAPTGSRQTNIESYHNN